jgi:cysteine synthase A
VTTPVDAFVSLNKHGDKRHSKNIGQSTDISSDSISVVRSLPDTIEIKPSESILELIGIDPILKLTKFKRPGHADIYAKLEYMNPSGSIKDRMVAYAIKNAEKRGKLRKGYTIVEATSGNTGVALAMVAATKGYKSVIVMPKSTSDIKKKMMRSFGAKLVLTPDKGGIAAVVNKAKELAKRKNSWMLNQFENPDNPRSHIEIGKEIVKALGRDGVDAFVAAIGTGGTLVGVSKALKGVNQKTRIVAVEPMKAPAFYNMFYGKSLKIGSGISHGIEGIGEGFVPKILAENRRVVDDVMLVKDADAFKTMGELIKKEGVFVGMSSGANVWAALKVAKKLGEGRTVVTVLPDSGQRYLSSGIFK